MRIPKILAQNIIFNTISNFMFHFVNFKYSLENSKQVILYFCKKYELDQSRTHLLLSELESAQNHAELVISSKELAKISKDKFLKRKKNSDNNDNILFIKLVLKFIGPIDEDLEDISLKRFLVLDKYSSALLKKQVLKQALIYETNEDKLMIKRVPIWKKILGVDQDTKDYFAFRDKVNSKS